MEPSNPNIATNNKLRGLGREFPGDDGVSVIYAPESPLLRSCASVYIRNDTQGAGVFSGTVRLNLFSEVQGIKGLIASAFVPPGFNGLAITASGFVADSWHVWAQAESMQTTCGLALACCDGCAAPSVVVASGLQQPGPGLPPEMTDRNPAPQQTATGRYRFVHLASGESVTLARDERVISIFSRGNGNFDWESPDGTSESVIVVNEWHADPDGAIVGGTVTAAAVNLDLVTVR